MSSKKNPLLVGAILGTLAAGTTIYLMKNENGQIIKERTKEKLLKLKEDALRYMEEKGCQPSEIKEKLQGILSHTNENTFSMTQPETIALSTPDHIQKEFTEIESEIQQLEKHLHQNDE